jgi:hypothetical protein
VRRAGEKREAVGTSLPTARRRFEVHTRKSRKNVIIGTLRVTLTLRTSIL